LRKKGDTKHYLPQGGMFNRVTSANYFGELVEWTGFAIATWSMSGLVFVIWTFANLVPRANALFHQYKKEFVKEMQGKNLKRIFPFVY
jgi:3-oxo-5-alpha-steroid 4-dehydrogenase 1